MGARGGADGARGSEDGSTHDYVRWTRRLLAVEVARVTLVDEPSGSGTDPDPSRSLCRLVVRDGAPLVVADTHADERLRDETAVIGTDRVAYAGWPLTDEVGTVVGALCAIDEAPRTWEDDELAELAALARSCSTELQRERGHATSGLARAIVSGVGVAIAFYDHRGRLLLANDEAARIAEAAGRPLDAAPYAGSGVRRADRARPGSSGGQVVPRATWGDLQHHEVEWVGHPGRQVAVTASAQRLERADGSTWGTLVVMHDVTELAIALEVQERFTATVSHELRTPLTAILGFAELLTDDLDGSDPRQRAHLALVGRIESSAQKLRRRVSDLLDAAERRRRLDLRALDLVALVRRTLDGFAPQLSAAGVELVQEGDDDLWATADAARVEQAVENLVSNAIKYNRRGGRVTVGVHAAGDRVRIDVTDTGLGMTDQEAAMAFDRHWRSSSARASDTPGLGIGLALVHEIVSEHRGSVTIDSSPGEGSTFSLTLPRVPA